MNYPVKVLLIDDQPLIALGIQKILEKDPSIECLYCKDGREALKMARHFKPTVILQDLVMPDIDGLTLVKILKSDDSIKKIPLIVLSSKEEAEIKAACFFSGANDYLVKIPHEIELLARIHYHSKSYIGLLQRDEAYQKLKESQDKLKSELDEAGTYVKSLLPPRLMSDKVSTDWLFIPSTILGGDIFDYSWIDEDYFSFFIIDVCGHGVGAALLSVSILNSLRNRTLNHVDYCNPSSVLTALNKLFPMEKHQEMFFTIFYGVIDFKEKKFLYCNGGHPPQLLFNGPLLQLLKGDGTAVGVEASSIYTAEVLSLKTDNEFFLFSDGTFEMHDSEQRMLTLQRFIEMIKNEHEIKKVLDQVIALEGNPPFEDDFSFLNIKIKI